MDSAPLARARRRRPSRSVGDGVGARRPAAAAAATAASLVVVLLLLLLANPAAASASPCGHSLPAVRAMERAAASRLRIQQARESGSQKEGGGAGTEGDRRDRLRAALAAGPPSGAPLRVAVLSRLSPSSSSSGGGGGGDENGDDDNNTGAFATPAESDVLDAFDTAESRAAALDYAERVLVPGAIAALGQHLRLRLPSPAGAPLVPAEGAGSLAAAASCGAARRAGAEIASRRDLQTGEADLALFLTAATGAGGPDLCPPGAVAWAVACARDAALTGRPVAAAVNLCPRVLEQGPAGMPAERAVAAVVHELVHVMGFQRDLFDSYFSPETGAPHDRADHEAPPPSLASVGGGGPTERLTPGGAVVSVGGRPYLTTPRARAAARAHFGCASLPGAPLEDEGGEGSALSHWEATVLNHELMAPATPEDGTLQRLSPLTLAALADSGWWVVAGGDSSNGGGDDTGNGNGGGDGASPSDPLSTAAAAAGAPMDWGRGAGCDFVTKPCAEWAAARAGRQPYFCPSLPTPGFSDGRLLVAAGLVPPSAAPAASSRAVCTPDGRALATCADVPGPGAFTNGCVLAASSAPWRGGARLSCASGAAAAAAAPLPGRSGGEYGGGGGGSGGGDGGDDEWWSPRELRVFEAMGGGAGGGDKYCATPASSDPADRVCPTAAAVAAAAAARPRRRWGAGAGPAAASAAATPAAPAPTCGSEAAMGTYWCVAARCVGGGRGVALDVALRNGTRRLVPCEAEAEAEAGAAEAGAGAGAATADPGAAAATAPDLAPWEQGVADLARHLPGAYSSGRVTCPPAATVCAGARQRQQQQQQQQQGPGGGAARPPSSCARGGGGSGGGGCAPPFGECAPDGASCRCLRLDAAGPDCRGSVVPDPPAPYYRRLRPYGG